MSRHGIDNDALQRELRAAYDAGVDMGERGFAEDKQELDIGFAVHLKMRANRARKHQGGDDDAD